MWCIVESHSSNGQTRAHTQLQHYWKPGQHDIVCLNLMHFNDGRWYAIVGRTDELMKSVPMQERTACGEQAWKLVNEKEKELGGAV